MNAAANFEDALFRILPRDDEGHLLEIDELIAKVKPENPDECFTAIFKYFEKYPEEDFGAPGTLVHFVETGYPKYIPALNESLQRQPSTNTILMVNRILNSKLEDAARQNFMSILEQVSKREDVSSTLRGEAAHFLNFQRRKGN